MFCLVPAVIIGGFVPAPSFSAGAVFDSYPTWQRAALELDPEGTIYLPTFRAGLKQDSRIDVLAFKRTMKSGDGVKYSSMLVTGSYKKRLKSFTVMEKYASAKWAARRVSDPGQRIVVQQKIQMNEIGTKVRVTIYANCAVVETESNMEQKTECSREDVKSFGGLLVMDAPRDTSIIIESTGLSFQQLVSIAQGLKPLAVGN